MVMVMVMVMVMMGGCSEWSEWSEWSESVCRGAVVAVMVVGGSSGVIIVDGRWV